MAKVIKQFPGPSLDNPALLDQFAHTLTGQYAGMFPVRRGFAVELKDKATKKSYGWEIRILHGKLGGTKISIRPSISSPHHIRITALSTSRFEEKLIQCAVWLALILMAPFLIAGGFKTGFRVAFIVGAPFFFVLAFALGMVATLIGRLFSRFDHHFDAGIRRRILATAGDTPLPSILERPEIPTTPTNTPPDRWEALPKRTGPSLWVDEELDRSKAWLHPSRNPRDSDSIHDIVRHTRFAAGCRLRSSC